MEQEIYVGPKMMGKFEIHVSTVMCSFEIIAVYLHQSNWMCLIDANFQSAIE